MLDDASWDYETFIEHADYGYTARHYGVGTSGGVRLVAYHPNRAGSFGVHVEHDLHQLTWLSGATLHVFTGGEFHIIPSTQAIWIPAGTAHDIACTGPGRLLCLYFRADAETLETSSPTLIAVDELIRGLLGHLLADLTQEAGLRARDVLLDALRARLVRRDSLQMPGDRCARAVAEIVMQEPHRGNSLEQLAMETGVSARTIRRRFLSETGLTFRQWVHRARLTAALPLLQADHTVQQVSRLVGYESAAAFTAAFRAQYGETPRAYRAHLRAARALSRD